MSAPRLHPLEVIYVVGKLILFLIVFGVIFGGPLAKWSKSDIETVLSTGFTPEGDSLGGDMAAVVRNLAQAPPADISAMAEFIKSLPAIPSAGK